MLATSSLSYSQTTVNATVHTARMTHDNNITIRTGLHETYKISIGHFDFTTTQEAVAYFQTREVSNINIVVTDQNTVLMNFNLNDPSLAGWTMADWNQVLDSRATNVSPRTLKNNK